MSHSKLECRDNRCQFCHQSFDINDLMTIQCNDWLKAKHRKTRHCKLFNTSDAAGNFFYRKSTIGTTIAATEANNDVLYPKMNRKVSAGAPSDVLQFKYFMMNNNTMRFSYKFWTVQSRQICVLSKTNNTATESESSPWFYFLHFHLVPGHLLSRQSKRRRNTFFHSLCIL